MDRLLTKHLQRCLWTTTPPNNKSGSHRCVVAIRRNYAVTYQHKGHSKLKLNDRLTIYNVMDLKVTLEVVVVVVSQKNKDFLLLKLDETDEFPAYPTGIRTVHPNDDYRMLGVSRYRLPSWKTGVIGRRQHDFVIGTSFCMKGDSGSGIFDNRGRFMGMTIGQINFRFDRSCFDEGKINFSAVAAHFAETQIIEATVILPQKTEEPMSTSVVGDNQDNNRQGREDFGDRSYYRVRDETFQDRGLKRGPPGDIRRDDESFKRNKFEGSNDTHDTQFNSKDETNAFAPMMTFRKFLMTQEDGVSDNNEAVMKYNEYKKDYIRNAAARFFEAHKDEEWFHQRYFPGQMEKRAEERSEAVNKRLALFNELITSEDFNFSLDYTHSEAIIRLLDIAVIKLEGGSDEDIAAARTEPIVDDAITELLKLNTDAVNGNKQAATTEGAKLLDDHKTTSIFFKNIPTSVSIQQLEEVCKGFPGFLRLWLSDPVPEAKFGRRAFASFRRDVRVKKIFWGLKGQKIGDVDLGAAVNRDIKRRVRWVNGLTRHRTVAQNDLKLAAKLVVLFDYKNGLYKGEDDEAKPEPPTDLELAIARSKNPVLENITEFLIEEANAEEDVLLGLSESSTAQSKQTFEVDEEMLKTLDKIVLYLRIVYSFDFYGHLNYPNEDSMPNKLGIIHVRGVPPAEKPDLGRSTNGEVFVAQSDIDNYNAEFEAHIEPLLKLEVLSEEDLVKLGKKDPEKAVEEFIEMNTVELGKDKWLCPLSGKKFKGAEIISLDLDLNLENDNAIVSSSYFKTLREHVVRMIPFGVAVIQTCSLPNWSA